MVDDSSLAYGRSRWVYSWCSYGLRSMLAKDFLEKANCVSCSSLPQWARRITLPLLVNSIIEVIETMIITNTETIAGYRIVEFLGLVQGNTVRAKHAGRDIAAGFKNLVGGELKGYTELLTESRRQAVERMMAQAEQLGANGIVNVRFTTSAVTTGAAELYAYGTAVNAEPSI